MSSGKKGLFGYKFDRGTKDLRIKCAECELNLCLGAYSYRQLNKRVPRCKGCIEEDLRFKQRRRLGLSKRADVYIKPQENAKQVGAEYAKYYQKLREEERAKEKERQRQKEKEEQAALAGSSLNIWKPSETGGGSSKRQRSPPRSRRFTEGYESSSSESSDGGHRRKRRRREP